MLKLAGLTLREISLTLKEPFRISSGVTQERRILLLEVRDADGVVGFGECVAGEEPNYSPETLDTAWLILRRWIAPLLLGQELRHPREVFPLLEEALRGHLMAKAAVEMACWALWAERSGRPLAEVLGGERRKVRTGISLGIQESPEALATKAVEARRAGYAKIKLKIAPGRDLEFVAAVHRELAEEAALMVDANNAYDLADADHLARLDAFGLVMIEQPLHREDLLRHAKLQRRLRTPICLDESITSVERAQDMIELEAGRIINIKPGRVGGFAASLAIHDLCRRSGVPVWCGGMLESGIGRSHNVALASLPGFTLPGDLSPSQRYWRRDIVDPEWTMDDEGYVAVPWERPGLGVTPDTARIEALTVRREELERG